MTVGVPRPQEDRRNSLPPASDAPSVARCDPALLVQAWDRRRHRYLPRGVVNSRGLTDRRAVCRDTARRRCARTQPAAAHPTLTVPVQRRPTPRSWMKKPRCGLFSAQNVPAGQPSAVGRCSCCQLVPSCPLTSFLDIGLPKPGADTSDGTAEASLGRLSGALYHFMTRADVTGEAERPGIDAGRGARRHLSGGASQIHTDARPASAPFAGAEVAASHRRGWITCARREQANRPAAEPTCLV